MNVKELFIMIACPYLAYEFKYKTELAISMVKFTRVATCLCNILPFSRTLNVILFLDMSSHLKVTPFGLTLQCLLKDKQMTSQGELFCLVFINFESRFCLYLVFFLLKRFLEHFHVFQFFESFSDVSYKKEFESLSSIKC